MRLLKYIASLFSGKKPAPAEPQTIREELAAFDENENCYFDDLVILTGLKKKKIKAIAKYYKLKYSELVEYYLFFDRLPSKEHTIIMRHIGVGHIIYTVRYSENPEEDLKKDFEFLNPAT